MIRIEVRGIPAPQGSKSHVGHGIMVESSKKVKPWREAVRAETQRQLGQVGHAPLPAGAAKVTLHFTLRRPKSHFGAKGVLPSAPRWPAVRPDLDKLARSTLDGLISGGALPDDSRIISLAASKSYDDEGDPVGVVITIEAI